MPVRFATETGGGTTGAQTDLTDQHGRARTTWSLGSVPGWQRLTASVPGLDSVMVVRAEADPIPENTRVSLASEPVTGVVGDALATPVTIRVTDTLGTALVDLPVSWTALDGGRISGLAARTDSMGEARGIWALGPKAGKQRARAQVGNPRRLPVFTVTITALHGAAALAQVIGGDGQKGSVAGALAHSILVRVTDRNGNRVSGAELTLHPETGSVADSSIAADENGVAQFHWTLGRSAGAQRLKVHTAGIDVPVNLTASALPLKAARISFAPLAVVAPANRTLARPVRVNVSDQYGNPLKSQDVWFSTRDGQINPMHARTDSHGVASAQWTLGSRSASQALAVALKGGKLRDSLIIKASASKPAPTTASAAPTILH